MKRAWKLLDPAPEDFRNSLPELSPTLLGILWHRGIRTPGAVEEYLDPSYEKRIHDPFFFRDMERATGRLLAAAAKGEKITIHGDYDADGVCASTILATVFDALGATYEVFLPHRELDGYGMNAKTVAALAAGGTKVIVTCDCGIANIEEIAKAKAKGIDTIITDHHAMPEVLPKAFATIHPKVPGETYPWDGLAGGGVAWKLAQAIIRRAPEKFAPGFDKWLLDLAAISSVADMVPLLGETRTIVKYGLTVLAKTKRPGLRALMEVAGVLDEQGVPRRPIDATTIGFQLAPRINAAGRLDHANAAYALLIERDPVRAAELARGLHETNAERQKIVERALAEARKQVADHGWERDPAIVVAGDWPPGIVGLIAGRLMDEHWRPAFAVSLRDRCVGSGRSIPEYHVVEAMRTFADVFEKFGGHPQACGFTVKAGMVDELRARLNAHAGELLGPDMPSPELRIDAEVALEAVTPAFFEGIRLCAPYGQGNPEPQFLARGLTVREVAPLGADGKHVRFTVAHHSGESRKMVAFGFGPAGRHGALSMEHGAGEIRAGDTIDAVFTLSENEWNGNRELQMKVVDLRKV